MQTVVSTGDNCCLQPTVAHMLNLPVLPEIKLAQFKTKRDEDCGYKIHNTADIKKIHTHGHITL